MAQPLDENVPPYVLQLFGTNNSFKSEEVLKRWEFIRLELERYAIRYQIDNVYVLCRENNIYALQFLETGLNLSESLQTVIQDYYQLCAIG